MSSPLGRGSLRGKQLHQCSFTLCFPHGQSVALTRHQVSIRNAIFRCLEPFTIISVSLDIRGAVDMAVVPRVRVQNHAMLDNLLTRFKPDVLTLAVQAFRQYCGVLQFNETS